MKRILLIANKNWEVEPILNSLLNVLLRSPLMTNPTTINYPWNNPPGTIQPRAIWTNFPGQQFELWCIQDIMDAQYVNNASSSQGKMAALPKILTYSADAPVMIVALGTAAYGSKTENHNGCVVMGSNVFIHNFHPNGSNPNSVWDDPADCEKVINSAIPESFFNLVDAPTKKSIVQYFIKPFLYPAETSDFIYNKDFLALSTVNVTDYHEYPQSDPAGMQAVVNANTGLTVGSVESTHGLIRLLAPACPFIFISGIVNRFTLIGIDVNGTDNQGNVKTNSVNYSGAFNIGVALGGLIPVISKFVDL